MALEKSSVLFSGQGLLQGAASPLACGCSVPPPPKDVSVTFTLPGLTGSFLLAEVRAVDRWSSGDPGHINPTPMGFGSCQTAKRHQPVNF